MTPDMKTMNDGGPAFPTDTVTVKQGEDRYGEPITQQFQDKGMSLRDWFAGQALRGILSELAHPDCVPSNPFDAKHAKLIAAKSYELADAMLVERDK